MQSPTYNTCREYQKCKEIKLFVRNLIKAADVNGMSVEEIENALRTIGVPEQLPESDVRSTSLDKVVPRVAASALSSMSQFVIFSKAKNRWFYKHAKFNITVNEKRDKFMKGPKRPSVIHGLEIPSDVQHALRERVANSKTLRTKTLVSYAIRLGVPKFIWVGLGEKRLIANLFIYSVINSALKVKLIESDGFGKWKRAAQ